MLKLFCPKYQFSPNVRLELLTLGFGAVVQWLLQLHSTKPENLKKI